ncbi:MAG: hypothetical protein U5M51_03235 [Emticicia sp.]|nr:hypothetical protein [Emticicia sp.]
MAFPKIGEDGSVLAAVFTTSFAPTTKTKAVLATKPLNGFLLD